MFTIFTVCVLDNLGDIFLGLNGKFSRLKKYSCVKCSCKKFFRVYDNLTRVQLHTCFENILCLIFVVFNDYKNFLTTKISRTTLY